MFVAPLKNNPIMINMKLSGKNMLGPTKKLLNPQKSNPRDAQMKGWNILTINGIIRPMIQ